METNKPLLDALEVIFLHIEQTIGGKTAKILMLFMICEFHVNAVISKEELVGILRWHQFE